MATPQDIAEAKAAAAARRKQQDAQAAQAAAQIASPASLGLTDVQVSARQAAAAAAEPEALPLAPTAPAVPTGPAQTTGPTGPAAPTGATGATGVFIPPPAATGAVGTQTGKKAINSSVQTINGRSVQVITFDDGTTQQIDLGSAPGTQNALQLLKSVLGGYGIDPSGSLSNAILGLLQNNYDSATIQTLIEDPNAINSPDANVKALATAWQTRFAGNVQRAKAGLTPLSPSEYINTENAYKAVMTRAGLDAAHQDATKLAGLIGTDVSPAEVNQRINAAMAAVTSEDPYVIDQLKQQFNLTTGDLVGHLLDPATQSSVIANKVSGAQLGAEFERQGITPSAAYSYQLATMGISQAQAAAGAGQIAGQIKPSQELASRYGYMIPQGAGQALFTAAFGATGSMSQAEAEQQLQRLKTQEVSAFSGSSGVGKGSLMGTEEGAQ